MKLQQKIIYISLAAAVVTGLIFTLIYRSEGAGFFVFAITTLLVSVIEFLFGLIMLFHPNKQYAQGFLISGGLIFLIGFVTCTAGIGGK